MRARAARGSAYTRASVTCESARAFDPLMNRHRVGTYPAGCWNSSRPKVGCHLPRGALEFQSVSKIACMMFMLVFVCVQLVRNGMVRYGVDAALGIQQSFRQQSRYFREGNLISSVKGARVNWQWL